jgi:hypothetical protein
MPCPSSLTVCELPAALWVTVMLPRRLPVVMGAKVTLIVHCEPTAS